MHEQSKKNVNDQEARETCTYLWRKVSEVPFQFERKNSVNRNALFDPVVYVLDADFCSRSFLSGDASAPPFLQHRAVHSVEIDLGEEKKCPVSVECEGISYIGVTIRENSDPSQKTRVPTNRLQSFSGLRAMICEIPTFCTHFPPSGSIPRRRNSLSPKSSI